MGSYVYYYYLDSFHTVAVKNVSNINLYCILSYNNILPVYNII